MNHFYNEINEIIKSKDGKKFGIFVDMDGVIADYRFGEGKKIMQNEKNVYLNKRTIYTSINIFNEISQKVSSDMHIISSCYYASQVDEKNRWLDTYAPFFNKEYRNFVFSNDFEDRKMKKINCIKQEMNKYGYEYAILIDDTHDVLKLAISELGDKLIPFHVISIFD